MWSGIWPSRRWRCPTIRPAGSRLARWPWGPATNGKGWARGWCRQRSPRCASAAPRGCLALGEPAFFRRLGFAVEPGLVLPEAPASELQALAFGDRLLPLADVSYHPAFGLG
ncbi:hypothetical protein XFF6166_310025 [Xanthomonas citri pv. fuscans]|nr:hypothetical protein CKU38_01746 [Xanthomonas citri pv. fuscans]SON78459.1 hypothetical protein XFF6166_310025 [Xanthomonas citri pv. fuscans]SOO00182.1 hypothetical protein XFF6960_250025 [Xanthomonas citri pv. fuscans]SOO02822.1 hypothetical protein XFF7767_120025 [Xanthomonas citri pv. fuscans]SOO10274.1 hypothetical protein XFF6970_510085 [Xanthomonas citri pv. fuscans]